jgi:hypothetical protein
MGRGRRTPYIIQTPLNFSRLLPHNRPYVTMTLPDLITTFLSQFRSLHTLLLSQPRSRFRSHFHSSFFSTWLYHFHSLALCTFKASKEIQIRYRWLFLYDYEYIKMQLHTFPYLPSISLLLQESCSTQTPIFALATSTSFSHSSGVFRRRERACRPILSNSSFKRLLTIRWRWIAVLEAKAGETIATAKSGYQLLNNVSQLGLSQYWVIRYGIPREKPSGLTAL